MNCEEAKELITALIDNELSGLERSSLEGHLKECPRCQTAYQDEMALKRDIRRAGTTLSAPAALRQRILSDQRLLPERSRKTERWAWLVWPARLASRPAFVAALLVLVIVPALYLMRPAPQPISLTALDTHDRILRGDISLIRAQSQEELRARLHRSVGERFAPMGYDLSMVNLRPVAGVVQDVKGRKILVTVYNGGGLTLTCYTFLGSEKDSPASAALFFDPEKKINFYTFSRNGVNGVLHREGSVICILVSKMPMQDLLDLARSKARPS